AHTASPIAQSTNLLNSFSIKSFLIFPMSVCSFHQFCIFGRGRSKQKGAPRRAGSCGQKNARLDCIKLSMTKLRGYIVIAPLRLL
ncbi:MAG: hypothetical protein K2H40_07200, partial [Lachnospiraceae bacterium]|nr:hypothetical protein [Lachnospiraceae bacterium]